MKKYLLAFSLLGILAAHAQNNVGIGTLTPNASALLELQAADKGFLITRTTIAQITGPAVQGLVIYDTDSNCIVYYTGSAWRNLCGSGGGTNDSIYFNPDGTISVKDLGGIKTSPQKAWITDGNAGTTAGTNFLGTTDAQDLVVKSNNTEVLRATTTGSVGINQPTPVPSALLEMQSTTKGVLFPALSTTERDAIAAPAVGLVVYNKTLAVHQFWNGTCWVNVGQTVCSFDYSLTQSQTTGCLLKTNFNTVFDTLTVALVSGTPSPVVLSAAGVPAGILVNFSNNYLLPTQTSYMSFTALPSAANGVYTITVLATSGSVVKTLTYTLTVYDFGVTLSQLADSVNELNIAPNSDKTTATITIGNPGACGSSGSSAILSASNLPVGVTVTFGTSNLNIPGNTTMTVQASSCAVPGVYTLSINATIGAGSSSTSYTLTVLPSVINITASVNNLNLFNLAGNPSCGVSVTFNVAAGVTIGSTTTAQAALISGSFGSGSAIIINNNGTIAGKGGDGGENTGGLLGTCSNIDGLPGGNAIQLDAQNIAINNNGTIGGGGGGGGTGAGRTNNCGSSKSGAGGGGGAGAQPGSGGSGGTNNVCNAGNPGTATTGGNGGTGCTANCVLGNATSGNGGKGGDLGQAGTGGTNGSGGILGGSGLCSSGNGGAAGCAIKTNGNVYTSTGAALLGAVCP